MSVFGFALSHWPKISRFSRNEKFVFATRALWGFAVGSFSDLEKREILTAK